MNQHIMKPPESPKPRIIREDFLPERNTMENYRIKKITKGDGKIVYYAQKKVLGFWWINLHEGGYENKKSANTWIVEDIQYWKDGIVEYLEPDLSKNTKPDPNPPPNLV